MQDEAESVEQLAHDNAQLRSRLEALEQAYDELEEANEQQFKHIDALKKEKRDLEALCQRRKADMEDMVALQEHCSSLERQLRETKSALQGARSELRKASFQLQLRNARNASVSSRTSTTEGTSSSISSMSQSRSRTFNTARDVLKARRKLLQKLKSADDTDIPPPSPPPQAGPIQAGPATTAAAATAVAAGDVQERIDAAVAAVACAYEKRIASLQDALDEEMQRRKDLQLAHDHAITADAGTAGDHAGDATHGGGDADTSGSGLNLAEELSRVASSDVPLPVGADLTQATQASSHTDATTPRAASTSEAATASEDDSTSGADAKNAGTNSGDARASSGDKTDGASSGSSNSTTTCAGDGGDGDGGGGRRIVLPVSAALTTELRGETQYFGRSDEQTDETLQQQIIMELESEVAELREELEDLMEERDSALSDLTKVKADRTTSMEKLAGLNSEITSLHQRIEALSTEHRSLQRRFLTRGDQLIALRRICNEHGLGDIVRAKLNHMQQAVVRDRMQKGEHLRERLYTQVDRAENVQARRQRAATMMQEATRRASVAAQRTTNGSVASAAHNKKESPLEAARRAALARRNAKRAQQQQQPQHPPQQQSQQQSQQPTHATPQQQQRGSSALHARHPHTVSGTLNGSSNLSHSVSSGSGGGAMSTRERLASVSTALRRASMSVHGGKPVKPRKPQRPPA